MSEDWNGVVIRALTYAFLAQLCMLYEESPAKEYIYPTRITDYF